LAADRGSRLRFPWTAVRRTVQVAALAAFVWLFLTARSSGEDGGLSTAVFRLDPLAMLARAIAGREFAVSSALALLTVALTLVFGRAWCGWLCPLGTLLDFFPLRRKRRGAPPAEAWRGLKHALWIALLAAALFGNLTLLFLDPVTLTFRTLNTTVWPALDRVIGALEAALYRLPALRGAVVAFDQAVRPAFLPTEGLVSRWGAVAAGLLLVVILLNLFAERFWCRYLCPLGGLLGLLSKAALVQRRVEGGCGGCHRCVSRCPTGTIRSESGHASDPAECTMCMACLAACPMGETHFPARIKPARWYAYDPGRRQALLGIGAGVAGAALLRGERALRIGAGGCLRPPGSDEDTLLSACIRCGACQRTCPTGALQPAQFEIGIEGWWSPVVVPRLGYCDYACNACGQICPTGAIPDLPLDEKRLAVIGWAEIDRERCIPWAEERDCIVCEEMCPLPTKAVILEHYEGPGADGTHIAIQRPVVLEDRCIGCGICEYKCPVIGQAAIRVYPRRPAAG